MMNRFSLKKLRQIFLCLMFLVSFGYSLPVFADTTPPATPPATVVAPKVCDCWCTSAEGAKKLDKKISMDDCRASCIKSGQRMSVCSYTLKDTPNNITWCFAKDFCEKQNGKLDGKQAPECMPGQQYCYPDPAKQPKTELSVAFGDYAASGNLGEYVNHLISWMLTAGIVIVIVLVMVGGLQYTLSAGSKELADKGKKRIKNAVTGMILLLCSYVILNSVNPNLLRMQVPQYPMVKRVELVDNATCESLEKDYNITTKEGGTVADGDKKCGTTAAIKSKKDGSDVTGATTCEYTKCDDASQRCLKKSATESVCARCDQVFPGSDKGVTPSSGVCAAAKLPDEVTNTILGTANYCFFTRDPTVVLSTVDEVKLAAKVGAAGFFAGPIGTLVAAAGSDEGKKLMAGTCAQVKMNCGAIRSYSMANKGSGCKAYDIVQATSGSSGTDEHSMENFFMNESVSDYNLKKLCTANPCDVKFYAENGDQVDSISQKNVCKMDIPGNYDLIKLLSTDCVQAGSMATGKTTWQKQTHVGSCDPVSCTHPYSCQTDITKTGVDTTACVSCSDMKGLKGTAFVCADIDKHTGGTGGVKTSARCTFSSSDNSCRQVNCTNVGACSNYNVDICTENICGMNSPKGCEVSGGVCTKIK